MSNYCDVKSLIFGSKRHDDKSQVSGAVVQDLLSGKSFTVRAKSVLLCAGPFTDELRRQADPKCQEAVSGSSGGK